MTPEEKDELRKRIETEIADCEVTIERLEEASKAVAPDNALGRLTRMESLGDQGVSKAKLAQQQEKRYKLRLALEKLNTPGFGICVRCQRPIQVERLLALPEAVICVACARRR